MGMCADHTLRLKFKDYKAEAEAVNAVRYYMEKCEKEGTVCFDLKRLKTDNVTPDTLDGIIKILLAYNQQEIRYYRWHGYLCFQNCFDSSYGWETVIDNAMEAMAPYLEDGSVYIIDADEGITKCIVKNGAISYE